jgi:hypothetical protein
MGETPTSPRTAVIGWRSKDTGLTLTVGRFLWALASWGDGRAARRVPVLFLTLEFILCPDFGGAADVMRLDWSVNGFTSQRTIVSHGGG